jgi:PAP2 superfamily
MSTFAGHSYGLHRRTRHQHVRPESRERRTAIAAPGRASWLREVALVAVLYIAYDVSRGLRNGDLETADHHGSAILRAESWLHIDVEHSLNTGIGHVAVLAVLASYIYATLHFIVTPAVLIWLYRKHPHDYGRARTALALATIIGLVIFWVDPTTPPRLLPGSTFQDTMARVSGWGWWGGDGSAPRGLGGLTNQLAAMPSLHVGWALWSGYWIYRNARRRWVRLLGAAYPVVTALVVMATANHYLLDVVAGAADVALAAWIVSFVARRRHRHDQASESALIGDQHGVLHPGYPADLSGLGDGDDVIDLRDVQLGEQPPGDSGHRRERERLGGAGMAAVSESGDELGRSKSV